MKKILFNFFLLVAFTAPRVALGASSDAPASYLNYLRARLLMNEGQFEAAEEALIKVIAASPATPSPWCDLASVYLATGKTHKALETADEIARRFSDDKETRKFLANLYAQTYSHKRAAYYYEKVLESEPDNEAALIFLANYYYVVDSSEAIKYLNRLAAQYPSNAQVFIKLAELYEKLKLYDEAIKNYRKSLELDDRPKEARLSMSRIYEIMKDTASAIAEYEAYLAEDPDNAIVMAYLGALYFYSGNLEKAREHLKRLAEISSETSASARIWLGALYADEGNIPAAISQFEKAAKTHPNATIYKYLSELHVRRHDFKSALASLESASRLEPSDPQIYFIKGLILMDTKKFGAAIKEFSKSIRLKPDFEDALFYRAVSYDNSKNFQKMKSDLERLLAINPRHHQASNYLAYSLAEKGIDLDRAHDLVTKALKEEPENPAYLDTLAWIYFKKKNLSAAEQLFDQLYTVIKSDWEILYHIARTKEEIARAQGADALSPESREKKLREADLYYRLSLFCEPPNKNQKSDIVKRLQKLVPPHKNLAFTAEALKNFAMELASITSQTKLSSQWKLHDKTHDPSGISANYTARLIHNGFKIKGGLTLQFVENGDVFEADANIGLSRFIAKTKSTDGEVTFIPFEPDDKILAAAESAVIFLKDIFSSRRFYELFGKSIPKNEQALSLKSDTFTISIGENESIYTGGKISASKHTMDVVSLRKDNFRIDLEDYVFLKHGKEIIRRWPRKIVFYIKNSKVLEASLTNIKFTVSSEGKTQPPVLPPPAPHPSEKP